MASVIQSVRALFAADSPPPALAALDAALAEKHRNSEERQRVAVRGLEYRRVINDADGLRARRDAVQSAIDQKHAEAEYSATAADVTEDVALLESLNRQLRDAEPKARQAERVLALITADTERLTAEFQSLPSKVDPLLRAAVVESMDADAADLLAAEQAYKAVHRRVFAKALAHDMLAGAASAGAYVDSGLFSELRLTRPSTDAFHPDRLGPEASIRAASEDYEKLNAEAVDYVNGLLARGG
jgi:hypothetical protein